MVQTATSYLHLNRSYSVSKVIHDDLERLNAYNSKTEDRSNLRLSPSDLSLMSA